SRPSPMRSTACTNRSIVRARARVATPAVGSSSSTASGVTTPAFTRPYRTRSVDIDRYIQRNDPTWRRLEHLARSAAKGVRSLDDDELTELVELYQRVSAHLSHARGQYRDPDLNARLSRILGEARVVIYRRRGTAWRAAGRFFTETFPAAVWHSRRHLAVAAICFLGPAIGFGVWLANAPEALDAAVPPELQELIAEEEFESYYSSDAAQNFAGQV